MRYVVAGYQNRFLSCAIMHSGVINLNSTMRPPAMEAKLHVLIFICVHRVLQNSLLSVVSISDCRANWLPHWLTVCVHNFCENFHT